MRTADLDCSRSGSFRTVFGARFLFDCISRHCNGLLRAVATASITSMSPDHLPVSLDVFATWRGMQDWIVETVLLSPLDFNLRLMPSRKTPCSDRFRECRPTGHAVELHRPMRQVSYSKLTGASSVDEKAPDARYGPSGRPVACLGKFR